MAHAGQGGVRAHTVRQRNDLRMVTEVVWNVNCRQKGIKMGHFLEPEEIPNYLIFEECFSCARQLTGMISLCFTFGSVTSAAIISAREKMGSQSG